MKKMRPHKKGFEPVVGVGCLMASYSYASRPCSGRRESGVDDRVLHSVRARTRARETFRKPPSRLEAQGVEACLLYTSDADDEEDSVDLGGRRIIKKKKKYQSTCER